MKIKKKKVKDGKKEMKRKMKVVRVTSMRVIILLGWSGDGDISLPCLVTGLFLNCCLKVFFLAVNLRFFGRMLTSILGVEGWKLICTALRTSFLIPFCFGTLEHILIFIYRVFLRVIKDLLHEYLVIGFNNTCLY